MEAALARTQMGRKPCVIRLARFEIYACVWKGYRRGVPGQQLVAEGAAPRMVEAKLKLAIILFSLHVGRDTACIQNVTAESQSRQPYEAVTRPAQPPPEKHADIMLEADA